ncbi:MAG: NADH:flavin oxidoreductase/NADH oxidase [Alphaproteobacteria bacterium]
MSHLFSELKVKDVVFKNRIGVAPMCQYSSIDGVATDWHMTHLGSRAVGGAGLIIAEATAVTPDGRITPGCAGLWNDQQAEALKPITRHLESFGCVPGIQIGHAGRKAGAARPWDGGHHLKDEDGGWPLKGPSDVAFDADSTRLWKAPSAMSLDEIAHMQSAFVDAAKRSLEAGYKLLEIHGAHGYLLHSFFSPLVNQREDAYGGSLENRARMMLETVAKVREVWPENLPLAVRLSVVDWDEAEGLTIDDNIQMAKWLKDAGVDLVDCSSGGANPSARASIGNHTQKQPDLAGQLRSGSGLMTMAVGCITDADQAEEIVASGKADMVLMARQFIREPYWAFNAAKQLGVDTKTVMPIQNGFYVG